MLYRSLIIFLFVTIVSSGALAGQRDLTIYCEYPPPDGSNPSGTGPLIYHQVWEMMRRAGISNSVETVSWKRGFEEATSKPEVALFPTTRTPEREALFHWVGPILQVQWAFYAHADSGVVVNSLADARNVRAIGTYKQDGKEQWLRSQGFTNLVSVMDNVQNLKKLYEHRIDLMAGSPGVTNQWPAMFGYDPAKMVRAYTFKSVDLYVAVSKGSSMDTVQALQKAFIDMIRDGTIARLYAKWTPERPVPEFQ